MLGNTNANFASLVNTFMNLIYSLQWLLSGVALLVFVYGTTLFIKDAGSADGRKKGRTLMVWGIVAITVMFSIQGILYLACSSFLGTGASCSFYYWTGGAST